ncbi:MAG: precorrin-6A/cobalt-precorrin-6A reductase, partial [Firmicutes bacterium]|nr:precorrin-6A/cobalt-precorrin-6A reductase [Bacillota bacterium]
MCKVIIFGGTTEGRLLAEFLRRAGIRTHVCTATEYGGSLLEEDGVLTVSEERLDEGQMKALIENLKPELVVDATHPFAKDVTCNIKNACLNCDTEYIRLLRGGLLKGEESGQDKAQCIYADSIKDAVTLLAPTEGKILVTTGSKELAAFTELENYKERVIARVLST